MRLQLLALIAILSVAVPGQTPEYELNDVHSSLTLNGVSGTLLSPAVTTTCPGGVVWAQVASQDVGNGWEMAVSPAPLVPASAGATTSLFGQIVNLDLANPGLAYVYGNTVPNLTNPILAPAFSFSFPANGNLGSYGFQMAVLTASHPDSFSLSQACQLDLTVGGLTNAPQGDDTSVTIPLGGNTCLPTVPFYGTTYTELHISSNGRVLFGSPSNDFSPSIAEAMSGDGFCGFWTDLNRNIGGTISLTSPAVNQVRTTWTNVPYYAEPSTSVSFSITVDLGTGGITLDGLQGIDTNPINNTTIPSNDTQFLGITMGNVGATDGGTTTFAAGSSGSMPNPTDMLYDWFNGLPGGAGIVPSLATGSLDTLIFTPVANGYSWQGQ